jgi:hypothetical protein
MHIWPLRTTKFTKEKGKIRTFLAAFVLLSVGIFKILEDLFPLSALVLCVSLSTSHG